MTGTPIFSIPEVAASQTQKEVTINNALVWLEAAIADAYNTPAWATNAATVTSTNFTKCLMLVCPDNAGTPATLTVPLVKKMFLLNNLAGTNTVVVGGATGATVTVPAGALVLCLCDGTKVLAPLTVAPAFTLSDMPTQADQTILGNDSGSTAVPAALTMAQVTAMLLAFTAPDQGVVPMSGGGTTNYLRADGSWAAPPGGGGATPRNSAALLAQWVSGATVTNTTLYFMFKAPYNGTVDSLDSLSGTGTFTANVKINSTSVTGLAAVAVSGGSPTNTTATAANTFSAGDTVSCVITSATGSPTDALLNLNVTWS